MRYCERCGQSREFKYGRKCNDCQLAYKREARRRKAINALSRAAVRSELVSLQRQTSGPARDRVDGVIALVEVLHG